MKSENILKSLPLLLIILNNTASAQIWGMPVQAVNPNYGRGARSGGSCKMLIVNGFPAMANYARFHLQYVRATNADGTAWGTPVTLEPDQYSGSDISLEIVAGNPAISYYDQTNGDLKYIRANDPDGISWGTPKIVDAPGDVGKFTSMAVVDGNPAISYFDETNGDLKFVRAIDPNGDHWSSPFRLDFDGIVGQYTSMKVINGKPAISYYDSTKGDLKFVSSGDVSGNTGTWGRITLDSIGNVGQYTSLQAVNGNPAISYYSYYYSFFGTSGFLKYIAVVSFHLGAEWSLPRILDGDSTTQDVGAGSSLQIVNGTPAISYYDTYHTDLKYIRCNDPLGMAWNLPIAVEASDADLGGLTSLQFVNGKPAICYSDYIKADMLFVRANDATGSAPWGMPVTFDAVGDAGEYISLQIVNGNPALSYYEGGTQDYGPNNYDLKYVRATNSSGTEWGKPITLDAMGDVGQYTSLQIVKGFPAISYFDYTNGHLKYVRANDSSGTSWGVPVTLDASGTQGGYTCLQIVNGKPAIAYYMAKLSDIFLGALDGRLKYIRATDSSGTNPWSPPVELDGQALNVHTFKYLSMQVVKGHPAIAYFSIGRPETAPPDEYLLYIRAGDSSGVSWNTGTALDVDHQGTGGYTSLKVVNGKPAISYNVNYYTIPGSPNKLKYIRAADSTGSDWSTGIRIPDSLVNIQSQTSLQVVEGNPAIAYTDYDSKDLKYVRATDASGVTWDTPSTLGVGISEGYTSMVSTFDGAAVAFYHSEELLAYFISGAFSCPLINHFIGSVSTAWEDPANWSCNTIPGTNTKVIIDAGAVAVLNSNTTINSILLNAGANFTVNSGVRFIVTSP